jgi:hypothetical protein
MPTLGLRARPSQGITDDGAAGMLPSDQNMPFVLADFSVMG